MNLEFFDILQLPLTGFLIYALHLIFKEYKDEKEYARKITKDSVSALNKLSTAIEKNTEALNKVENKIIKEPNKC
jgi:hypothetical protein